MGEALDKLIAAVEVAGDIEWGYAGGPARMVLGDNWLLGMNAYLGSLDSAVALKDALLPGWMMQIIDTYDGEVMVNLKQKCTQHTIGGTFGPSAARALLLATLRAVKGGADAA